MVSSILHAQQLVKGLKAFKLCHVVISPGSRNAPLTLSFAHDPYFKCYSIVDERCAAHVALGMAQQLREPVALVCTSGSAVLNYYPAIAEAFYSQIPLLILSADRPPYKIDIADGQTIRQDHVFKNHILKDGRIKIVNYHYQNEEISHNQTLINESLNTAFSNQGPVHLNVPFEEPLYNLDPESSIDFVDKRIEKKASEFVDLNLINKDWNTAQKKIVLISTLDPGVIDQSHIDQLLKDPSVLVMTEVSSNVVHDRVVWAIDSLIAPIENNQKLLEQWQPDIVVTIGGMIVSKKIKQQLRSTEKLKHYHVGLNRSNNTFFSLEAHVEIEPTSWIDQLTTEYEKSTYQQFWVDRFEERMAKKQDYLKQVGWSDFKVFGHLFSKLPDLVMLQLGNSSTVRYAQLFKMNPTHEIFSNRGTSGIDGSTSTAIGAAMVSELPTVFITGDVSFFYDSNALWNNYIPTNFKIILINNSGGGIFRILPGHENNDIFDTYFETHHQLTAEHLCKMFHFGYREVRDESAFAKAMPEFLNSNDQPQLLEVHTAGTTNEKILLDYFKFLR
ncbi:MAG: 2-succinyl-5-enolpyruvyl-6-hydroxy-3-cyclohexene-1-carboxylic-acid synthase [Nonlabens sp.]